MSRWSLFVLLVTLLVAISATAQVVTTLHYDTVPPGVACGDIWVESDIELYFTPTTAEDCDGGGSCFFGADPGSLWLFPSRLVVDLGQSYMIYRVEIDLVDYCGVGCSRAFAYNGGAPVDTTQNTTVGSPEVLVMDFGAGAMVDQIAVSSCEAELLGASMRITSATVDTGSRSWGSVKALYR